MTSRPLLFATLLATLLLAAPASAQEDAEPTSFPRETAHAVQVGNATLYHFVGPSASVMDEDVGQNESASLWFVLESANGTRRVAYLNASATSANVTIENGTLVVDTGAGLGLGNVSFAPAVADAGRVNASYAFAGELYEEQNGTLVLLGPVSGLGSFVVDVGTTELVPAPPTGIPTTWVVAGASVLVLGGGALAYGLRQRSIRRRMNEAPRRSQVLRERELEEKLQKAKDPEQVVQIQQEIRAEETVREKRRELQILEAKRADALKTMDLLRKRHEAGGLTKLQFDNMMAKKQADLDRIEAEIAQMEREGGGAAA